MNKIFNLLVDIFLKSDELGHYDLDNYSICLYDIPTNPSSIQSVVDRIDNVTKKYKIIINTPYESVTNIQILDIDL